MCGEKFVNFGQTPFLFLKVWILDHVYLLVLELDVLLSHKDQQFKSDIKRPETWMFFDRKRDNYQNGVH
jgi:hypothetical protein